MPFSLVSLAYRITISYRAWTVSYRELDARQGFFLRHSAKKPTDQNDAARDKRPNQQKPQKHFPVMFRKPSEGSE